MTKTANESNTGTPFTFDDIPKYAFCRYRGIPGFVVDKGYGVSEKAGGKHIKIELQYTTDGVRDDPILHERLVNRFIRQQRKLIIDWTGGLVNYE